MPMNTRHRRPTLMRHIGVSLTSLVVVLLVGAATCDPPPPRKPLEGFVDLHTHPLSNLGFGGKLLYGGVGVGALLPSDPDCNPSVRAASEERALGHDRAVHGGWDLFSNRCGDSLRERIIHALQQANLGASDPPSDAFGFPTFQSWPVWNDITHQKMWVEWIRRSFSGGLRVMVALAVNNRTLGDLVSGPGDLPTDDKTSADLQIAEIKLFVASHPDFMELAFTAEDIARITSIPKLAVVIGVEIDHIGNQQTATWSDAGPSIAVPSAGEVRAEIHRLYDAGVRYIFPIHLLDNAFGGTAAYVDLFNVSNMRESGAPWALKCACPVDGIDYTYQPPEFLEVAISVVKLGRAFVPDPGPGCPSGQRNSRALTATGIEGIREMMRLGMLIDIDHMSQDAVDQALSLAETVQPGGYPLNSGHNNLRGPHRPGEAVTERALTATQYQRIGALHGMAGVGSSEQDAEAWLKVYLAVTAALGHGAVAGFGTDTNGLALGMPPRPGSAVHYTSAFPASRDGPKTWNYNEVGVAHYGMLPDFLQDVGSLEGGAAVVSKVMGGTEYFYQTWRKAEQQRYLVDARTTVGTDVGACPPAEPTPRFHWSFEGNTSNTGSEQGFALTTPAGISFVDGRRGMAASFGPGQYSNVAGMRAVLGMFTDVTIAFWLREPGNLSLTAVVDIDNRTSPPFGGIQLGFTGASTSLCVSTTSNGFLSGDCTGPQAPSANTFHHWILRYHGTGSGAGMGGPTEVYVDGALVHTRANDTANDPVFNTTGMPDVFTLGAPGTVVDDVRIYDRVFTPAEQCTVIIGGAVAGTSCTLP